MSGILGNLPGIPNIWKIATGAAGVVSLVLISLLMTTYFENRDLLNQRTVLMKSINDPLTGYVAQLAQAHTNEETLKTTVTRQTVAYNQLSRDSQAKLAAAEAALKVQQGVTRQMEVKLHDFMATKPKGATLEDRVRDIDTRAMSELVE
jgi:hypothetical protein